MLVQSICWNYHGYEYRIVSDISDCDMSFLFEMVWPPAICPSTLSQFPPVIIIILVVVRWIMPSRNVFQMPPLVLLSRPLLNGMLCQLIWNRSNPSLFSRNGWNSIYLLLTEDRSNVTCHLPLAFSHTIVFTAKIIFYWFMFHEDPDGNKSPDFSGLSSSIALTIAKLCPVLYWNRIHSFIHSFKALNPNDPNNNFCISTPLDTQTRNVLDNALNWFPTPPAVEQNKSCFDLAGQLWALWCFRFCSVFKYCSRPDRYEQLVP